MLDGDSGSSDSQPRGVRLLAAARVLAFVLSVLTLSPTPLHAQPTETETAQPVFIVGHRGAPQVAPENTIPAHEAALIRGANVIELDVRMTRDGHFVVIHDATVDRTTNGRGRVSRMTLAEIKALDAGLWKGPEFVGTKVPTLREALANLKGRAGIDIDFKAGPRNSGELLADILDEEGYNDGTLVTVFARAPHYDRLRGVLGRYALRPVYQSRSWIDRVARRDGIRVVGMRRAGFSRHKARYVHDENMALFLNLMGKKEDQDVFAMGVGSRAQFLQTNNVSGLYAYLHARNLQRDCVPSIQFECMPGQQEHAIAPFETASIEQGLATKLIPVASPR